MATLESGSLPPAARLRLINAIIRAFDNDLRQQILAHLMQAGRAGLRSSEVAGLVGRPMDQVSKNLRQLQHALLVENQVGRDDSGMFSRYAVTDLGKDWFLRLQLKQDNQLLPLLA